MKLTLWRYSPGDGKLNLLEVEQITPTRCRLMLSVKKPQGLWFAQIEIEARVSQFPLMKDGGETEYWTATKVEPTCEGSLCNEDRCIVFSPAWLVNWYVNHSDGQPIAGGEGFVVNDTLSLHKIWFSDHVVQDEEVESVALVRIV